MQGYYKPTAFVQKPSQYITKCSKRTTMFHFDPAALIQSELGHGVDLADLKWPSTLDEKIHSSERASKAIIVFYCIAIVTTGLSFLSAVMRFTNPRKVGTLTDALFYLVADPSRRIRGGFADISCRPHQ